LNTVNNNESVSDNAALVTAKALHQERLNDIPSMILRLTHTNFDFFADVMEKPNNPPSTTPFLSFSLPKSHGPSPEQVDDACSDALTEVTIQQSLDESCPEELLALAQAAVGTFGPPKHQFSHHAEDGEERQKLREKDMGMEIFENMNEDNDTEMADANHSAESSSNIDSNSESDPAKDPT
jgi:hypothetical protein